MLLNTRLATTPFDVLREVDRMFANLPGALGELARPAFPAVNLWETGDTLHAEAELPGFKFEDIEVFVEGHDLTIKGRRELAVDEQATLLRRERVSGSFTRKLTLPVEIDGQNVTATLRDGILRVTLPKAPAARARKIEVQAG